MGERATRTIVDKCKLGLVLALLFAGQFSCLAQDISQNDKATLEQIERRLFFKAYSEESVDHRLERIEKRIFGEPLSGDFNSRFSRVKAAAPQGSGDSTTSSAMSAPSSGYQSQPATGNTRPQNDEATRKIAMERAQLDVMAAREEEITRLLADAVALWRSKRTQESVDKFEQVLRLDPRNAQAHFSLGIAYESMGNIVEASASYKKAYDESPANKDYRDALVSIEKKLVAKQKVDEVQGPLRALADEAAAAYRRSDFQTALSLYKELDAKTGNQALVKFNIGSLYMRIGDPFSALDYYKQAKKIKPNDPQISEACEKLEANLKKQQSVESAANAAWSQQPGTSQGQEKKSKKKEKKPEENAANNNQDLMSGYGLIGKSGRDGVVIVAVGIASRASKAGLLNGDVIKAVDGTVVKSPKDINEILAKKPPGSGVQLTVQRQNNMGLVNL